MFERMGEDRVRHLLAETAVLAMSETGIAVPLAGFYEDLDLRTLRRTDAKGP